MSEKIIKYLLGSDKLLITLAVINIVLTITGVTFIAYIN